MIKAFFVDQVSGAIEIVAVDYVKVVRGHSDLQHQSVLVKTKLKNTVKLFTYEH